MPNCVKKSTVVLGKTMFSCSDTTYQVHSFVPLHFDFKTFVLMVFRKMPFVEQLKVRYEIPLIKIR